MNTKIISSIFGLIVGTVGLSIFSGNILFGIIGGVVVAIVIYILQVKNER